MGPADKLYRLTDSHFLLKTTRIGLAQSMSQVKEQIIRNAACRFFAVVLVQLCYHFDEFDRQRRSTQEHVALPRYQDRRGVGMFNPVTEVFSEERRVGKECRSR